MKKIALHAQFGLRSQIVLNLAVIIIAGLVLLGILGIKISEHFLLNQKIRQAETISSMLMAALPSDVMTSGGKNPVLSGLIDRGIINGFFFIDSKGMVFSYERGLSVIAGYQDMELKATISTGSVITRLPEYGWFKGVGKDLIYYSPWIENGVISGGVKLILPLDDIKQDMAWIWRVVLFYLVVDSLVIIFFGVFLLSKSIIKPLKVLEETAGKIAGGRLEDRVLVDREDELGSLAGSFNIMADTLQEKIHALEKANIDLIEAQEGVIRAEKMAAIGRLSAGIAHEIGNPLGAVQGYLDILVKGTEEDEEKDILQRLVKETKRINNIITDFLNISRPVSIKLQEIDVNKVISETITFLKGSMEGIDLELALNDNIPPVKIDEGQLHQVLVNMVLNAVAAMPGGGRLRIETVEMELVSKVAGARARRRRDDPPYADYTPVRGGRPIYTVQEGGVRAVRIGFTDTGSGIKAEDMDKVFDPFFTTKETGKGTGLGLAVSLGIIQAFGGEIEVRSKIGEGTTFEIFLPVSSD
ncbi:MAG: ATP-binding protein [Thermodesulfobacteriota bacterium]